VSSLWEGWSYQTKGYLLKSHRPWKK
jgi:hypothetical protein